MAIQFGIIDNDGQLFGMRGTTYVDLEAAEKALDFLRERRREMETEAVAAEETLKTVSFDNETADQEQALLDAVARWEHEKHRSFSIRRREVTPWTPVG
jgi:hypothetical protein